MLITQISGDVDKDDIEHWEASLLAALDLIEDNSTFKIFINMHGITPVNVEAHKRFRTIIPLTLADYGWKVGYVNLFEEDAKSMKIRNHRGIRCIGAAHSHHDETKMTLYKSRFSNEREKYFTDPKEARAWVTSPGIS